MPQPGFSRFLLYCLPPLDRLDLPEVLLLIEQQKYCLFHAPRQTGKTTCLLALADTLNRKGRYRAVYANIEAAQAYREQVDKGMTVVAEQISRGARDQIDDTQATALAEGLAQTWEYADRCSAADSYLVIFDRRPDRTWEEKIWQRTEQHAGLKITVWGMSPGNFGANAGALRWGNRKIKLRRHTSAAVLFSDCRDGQPELAGVLRAVPSN